MSDDNGWKGSPFKKGPLKKSKEHRHSYTIEGDNIIQVFTTNEQNNDYIGLNNDFIEYLNILEQMDDDDDYIFIDMDDIDGPFNKEAIKEYMTLSTDDDREQFMMKKHKEVKESSKKIQKMMEDAEPDKKMGPG